MASSSAPLMTVHAAIAEALAHHDVDTVFGLIGDANLFLVDSFVRNKGGRYIPSAHEAGATLMAIGYAGLTGKVGVATVTMGPGLSNTVSTLIEGVRGATPIVLLCGDTASVERDEISRIGQREMVSVTGAGFVQLRAPETLTEDLATAFRRAAVERRPIVFNMPRDMQWQEIEYTPLKHKLADDRALVPASDDLDDAVGIIATAKRPLVLAGRGAVYDSARNSLLTLAERIEAPLATTLKAKGLFQNEPFDLGFFGTMSSEITLDIIMASDCVVAFGAGLNPYTTAKGTLLNGKRVVHVDLHQTAIGRYLQPDVGVVGDACLTADLMLHWLNEAEIAPSGFRNEVAELLTPKSTSPNRSSTMSRPGTVDIKPALQKINAAVPFDRIFVTDAGRFLKEAWLSVQVPNPQSFQTAVNYGAIGMGLPQAIGAACADNSRPTLLVMGDGGFMLGGLMEFNTAVRCGCDLIVVVCNDASYGAEHVQFRYRDMDPEISLFDWPDFAPIAITLGGEGVTVRSDEDLELAVAAIEGRKRPLLIDIKLDPDNMPELS